jgi:hypothetical protein
MPTPFVLHLYAALAEKERRLISETDPDLPSPHGRHGVRASETGAILLRRQRSGGSDG